MDERTLGADEWRKVLQRLDDLLAEPVTIKIIGGVAMTLVYGARRTTKDLDAILDPSSERLVNQAAAIVAREFDLADEWLNQSAHRAGLLTGVESIDENVSFPLKNIKLVAPRTAHLLAMKLAAFRGQIDREDALLLVRLLLKTYDRNAIENVVGGLVLPNKRSQSYYNLETLWEMLDELG